MKGPEPVGMIIPRVLRQLGVEALPPIIVDTREQDPLELSWPTVTRKLDFGDYGLAGFSDMDNPRFAIERKSLNDLVGSLTSGRPRFLREVEGLRRFEFRALVIEALEAEVRFAQYRSSVSPNSILATVCALQVRAGLHVIWAGDREGAARYVEQAAGMFLRGVAKDALRMRKSGAA